MRVAPAPTAWVVAAATSYGFTATSAAEQAGTVSVTTTPGNIAISSARRAGSTSTTAICSGVAQPARSKPPTSAAPMLPPPITARCEVMRCSLRGDRCGYGWAAVSSPIHPPTRTPAMNDSGAARTEIERASVVAVGRGSGVDGGEAAGVAEPDERRETLLDVGVQRADHPVEFGLTHGNQG